MFIRAGKTVFDAGALYFWWNVAFCLILHRKHKKSMKNLAYMAITAAAMLTAACSGSGSGVQTDALLTDTVTVADSMAYSGSTAEVTISGLYPSSGGAPRLTDSVRAWLADCLSWGTFTTEEPLIHASRQEIANGQLLIDHVNRKLLAAAKRDFIYLAGDSVKAGYEYQINFAPDFRSDSLLTYEYSTYCYLGGAHGSSVSRAATFVVPTGELLTYDNVFRPESRRELIEMVRTAVWEQYLSPLAAQEGGGASLKETLLIDPDALELPICGPQFGPEGITFTYGQYEIAPYAAGMPSCTLSYSRLKPLMRPSIISLLPLLTEAE